MSHAPTPFFEYRITVTAAHLDEMEHVNNVVYVQWMQDAAARHWNSVSTPALNETITWMVRKHEVAYQHQAFEGDELVIRTWTGAHSAVTWDRHYEITREGDGRKIISAKSVWIMLDKKTGKPKRIDEEILACFG